MAGTQLFLDIMARDHASAVFNKVASSADHLSKRTDAAGKRSVAFGRVSRAVFGGLSVYGVGMFLRSSLNEYAAAEAAQSKLEGAYKRFPKAANVSIESLRALNREMMQNTRFDDDSAAAMQANLMRFQLTAGQVRNLTPLIADLAEATGTDLVTAGSAFGKATLGNTRALKALGISYTATGNRAKDTAAIIDLLNKKVGGEAARAGTTTAAKMAILANQYGELKETVGKAVLPAFTKLVEVAGPAIAGIADAVDRNMPAIEQTFEDVWRAADKFGGVIKGVWDSFASLPPGVRDTLLLLGGATVAFGKVKGSALGQGISGVFSGLKTITAGHVTVVGKSVTGPGARSLPPARGPASTGGGVGKGAWLAGEGAGLVSMLSSAAFVSAVTVAAGAAYYKLMDPMPKLRQQGGNPTTMAGSYGSDRTIHTSRPQIRQDWVDKQAEVSAARYAAQWRTVKASIKDATGAYTLFAMQAKDKKWIDDKQPRAIAAAADRYEALARAVKAVPERKATKVSAPGAEESRNRVKGLGGAIGSLRGKTVPVKENGAASSMGRVKGLGGSIGALKGKTVRVGVENAQAVAALAQVTSALALVQSKTVTVAVNRVDSGVRKATGGHITGPGTGTSDSIPLWASNGEFMQPAASVSHYGVSFMEAVRTRRFPKPQGYKTGGKVKAAKRDARRQERLADFISGQDLSDPSADWFMGLEKVVQKRFMKHPKGIGRFARMAGAVQDRRNLRDAQRSYDQSTQARGLAAMTAQDRKNELASRVAATNKELANTKGPAARARLLAKLQDQEEQLAAATADLGDAQAAQEEAAKAAAEAQRELLESQQDAALDKVNALRDAVDGAAGSYRSFASIATTAVTDTAEAQQKLTDATDAVSAAQKKMDLAGNDRERAAAAAELNKALQDQASAQQGVAAAGKPSTGSIRSNMATRLQKLKDFGSAVKSLKAQGLNATTLAEILQMGPEQGYDFAKALLDGGLADINALQNEITSQSADLGYQQYGADAASAMLTGTAAATAAGLVANGIVMSPAPVTVSIDGVAIANALIAYSRQNGGSIPGLTS